MQLLFKELKSITIQARGKPPTDDKQWFLDQERERKQKKDNRKEKKMPCTKIEE
jgi:hypothetical protein